MFGNAKIIAFGLLLVKLATASPITQTTGNYNSVAYNDFEANANSTFGEFGEIAKRMEYLKCQTTEGSPFKDDLEAAATLVGRRTFCCQDSPSNCNDLVSKQGSAAISLCGSASLPTVCAECSRVEGYVRNIIEACAWKDPKQNNRERVGGWIQNTNRPEYRVVAYYAKGNTQVDVE